jgi:hypothetical protein
MLKITNTGDSYMLTIVDKAGNKIQYLMTDKETKNIMLKGWEEYIVKYCKYAKTFCKYYKDIATYVNQFCDFANTICGQYTFTAKHAKKTK